MTETEVGPEPAPKNGRRKQDRPGTERALVQAVLELLERDGILGGVSTQEVAARAGVNRGSIHHYFGSRRDLIKAAIARGLEDAVPEVAKRRALEPSEKGVRQFRDMITNPTLWRLVALLALDGDDTYEPLMFAEQRLDDFDREIAEGKFVEDFDAEALMVMWDSLLLGYSLLREGASRQLNIPARQLDRRLLRHTDRQMSVIRSPNARGGHGDLDGDDLS